MKLPDKPSELLRLALEDEEKCHNSPDYIVDMEIWHRPLSGKCTVCLAGAVMAQTLESNKTMMLSPAKFDQDTYSKLHALDYFRSGYIDDGLNCLDIYKPEGGLLSKVPVNNYKGRDYWLKDMNKIVQMLEEYEL